MTQRFTRIARQARRRVWAACALLAVAATAACTPHPVIGRMPSMVPLTSDLVLGQSTRDDVRRALGDPSGGGGSALPPEHTARNVWIYHEMKITDMKADHDIIRMNMTQRILLVFFNGDRYDGYMWYSNAGAAAGKPN